MQDSSQNSKIKVKVNLILLVILIANFFRNLGSSIVDIGLPLFILSLSGTLLSYGIVIGVFSITQSIFQFPLAAASDKFGRKRIIIIGMMIYITGTFLCFLAQSILQLIIFRAIQGAGAYSSILQAFIGDSFRKERKGRGMALYSFSLTLGYMGGIVIGGYISFYLGFRSVFIISGILASISLGLILIFLKDLKKSKKRDSNVLDEKEKRFAIIITDIKILIKNPQYEITVVLNSIRWFIFGGIISFLIWVLQIYFGLNQIETSYILIIVVAVYVLFLLLSGRLVDRHGTKKILLIGQVIIIVFGFLFFIVSLSNNLLIFLIASVFSGIGFALFQTSGNTLLLKTIELIDPNLKGTGFGFNNTIGFLCGAIGPVLMCSLGEFSLFLPYYVVVILVFIAFLLTLKFVKDKK
ncbi:MAG: MFS transporter [Promethearchaeota archaeon]